MAFRRNQIRAVYAALDEAQDYAAWLQAAEEHDRLSGADEWRNEDHSPHYDAALLQRGIARMRMLRASGQGRTLVQVLHESMYRHLNDLASPALYNVALAGTKHIVDTYLSEVEESMLWLAKTEVPGVSRQAKLGEYSAAAMVFGRSALLLSGGATLGFAHLGVVKALFEHDLLPDILSGSSTGAMIAAGVCSRNDEELADMYANPEQIRLDGLQWMGVRKGYRAGAWLDPEQLSEVLRNNIGEHSFAEAYDRSGRGLCISVSPTRHSQKPRLLSHVTAPDVLVESAVMASSALPGLFPPVTLQARDHRGEQVDYLDSERWVDGSLFGDLPKLRLSRLHNVNHFIVCQTNPHVLPFVQHRGRRGVLPAVAGILSATARTQGAYATDLARRFASRGNGPVRQMAEQAYSMVNQDYHGDIDIHPEIGPQLFAKVVSNPSRDDLAEFIRVGERAVWPQVSVVRNQTHIGRVFKQCVNLLRDPCPTT